MKNFIICLAVFLTLLMLYFRYQSTPEITNAIPKGENIICFGDSLTAGTGATEGMDYPAQLAKIIGRPVINAGIPGDTTSQALDRLEADVLSRSPRMVLITIGGNDMKNGISKNKARTNLVEIITRIQNRGALVVIGGIDVPFFGRGFQKVYQEVGQKYGVVLITNIYKGIMGKPNLMSDQIHPNNEGYSIMAHIFYDAIDPYL